MNQLISAVEAKKLGTEIINNVNYNSSDIKITAQGNVNLEQNVIHGDYLKDAIKEFKDESPTLEDQLLILAGYIKKIDNKEVNEAFNELNKSVTNKSSKFVVKSIWNGLVSILPDAVKLSDACVQIGSLFS